LEERLAWLQRHVTEQDKAMLDMSREIDRLKSEVVRLTQRSDAGPAQAEPGATDERPPHY
jgi:SlyX protein